MPFDSAGNFTRVHNWTEDRNNNIRILSTRMDAEFNNFAAAMNQVMLRNGLLPMAADLRMNGFAVTGIKAGSPAQPGLSFGADNATGMYQSGPSHVNVSVDGAMVADFAADGARVLGSKVLTEETIIPFANTVALNASTLGGQPPVYYMPRAMPTGVWLASADGVDRLHWTANGRSYFAAPAGQGFTWMANGADRMILDSNSGNLHLPVGAVFSGNPGGAYSSLNPGGDVHAFRGDGSGAVLLGRGDRYLHFDGANYHMPGAGLYVNGSRVLRQSDMGHGNGLNADLLDGQHAAYFTDIVGRLGYTPYGTGGGRVWGDVTAQRDGLGYISMQTDSAVHTGYVGFFRANGQRAGYLGHIHDASNDMQYINDVGGGHTFNSPVNAPWFDLGTSFYISKSGANPIINMDVNDYLLYDRAANSFNFVIGGNTCMLLSSNGDLRVRGNVMAYAL